MKRGNRQGMGSSGHCVCPACGHRVEHKAGMPCLEERCAKCGKAMVREGGWHDQVIRDKKGETST